MLTLTVDFEDHEGYVHAIVNGNFDPSGILTLFEKMFLYASTKGATKILFDCRNMDGEIHTEEIGIVSREVDGIHTDYEGFMSTKFAIAYVINEDAHDHDRMNRSMQEDQEREFMITSDFQEAEKWLQLKEGRILQFA